MTKQKNLTAGYALIQGFHWMGYAGLMGFASVYLLDNGFSNTQIGGVIAIAGVVSAILQPILAGYADRQKSPSLKHILKSLTILMLAAALLVYFFYGKNRLVVGVFYAGCITILQLLGWALIVVASVYYVNGIMEKTDAIKGQAYFTMTYTLGSVIGALVGGMFIDWRGVNAMLIFATAVSAVGMLIVFLATEKTK